jgi:hypothetical protein
MHLGLSECKKLQSVDNGFAVFAHLTRSSVRNGNYKTEYAFRLGPIGSKITGDAVATKATYMKAYVATILRRDYSTSRGSGVHCLTAYATWIVAT